MANVKDTKAALANKANNQVATQDKPQMTPKQQVKHYLEGMQEDIAKALPSHMTPERMTNVALTVIRSNPTLLECTIPSLLSAVVQAAQLGLEPGLIGHCYFVPYNNKKKVNGKDVWVKEVQFIIGFKGMISLARRSGEIKEIRAHIINENDEFKYELGLDMNVTHIPNFANPGKMIGVYAVAKFKDGGEHIEVMNKEQVDAIRSRSKGGEYGPWKTDYNEMARKTVIRRAFKYLPISIEIQDNVEKDNTVKSTINEEAQSVEYVEGEFTEQQQIEEPKEQPKEEPQPTQEEDPFNQ